MTKKYIVFVCTAMGLLNFYTARAEDLVALECQFDGGNSASFLLDLESKKADLTYVKGLISNSHIGLDIVTSPSTYSVSYLNSIMNRVFTYQISRSDLSITMSAGGYIVPANGVCEKGDSPKKKILFKFPAPNKLKFLDGQISYTISASKRTNAHHAYV